MANLKDTISQLFTRAGVKPEVAKAIIENPDLQKVEIDDSASSALLSNLLNVETATQSLEVKNALRKTILAEALDPVDKALKDTANKFIDDPDWIREFVTGTNTYDKLGKLNEKLAEAIDKKVNSASGSKASEEAKKQIEQLTGQIQTLTNKFNEEKNSLLQSFDARERDFIEQTYYSKFKWANEKVDPRIQANMAKLAIADAAQKAGAKTVYNKQTGQLELRNAQDESLPYLVNGAPLSFDAFTEKTLAESGLLAVSNPTPTPTPSPIPAPQWPSNYTGQPAPQGTMRDTSHIASALADLGAGN